MGYLDKKVLGELRGRLGEIVGRVRNGKHYISSAPSHYTMSKLPHEVDKRNRFGVNGKFGKAVRENGLLFRIWDKEKAPATNAYNKICKVNFKLCGTDRPSEENVITPEGFVLPVKNIQSLPDGIEAELEPFDMPDEEKDITYIMIVSFYEPRIKGHNYFELMNLKDYVINGLKVKFKFSDTEEHLLRVYKYKTVFLAAVTEDKNGNIVSWSATVSKDL
jgi:hypothetical protein